MKPLKFLWSLATHLTVGVVVYTLFAISLGFGPLLDLWDDLDSGRR